MITVPGLGDSLHFRLVTELHSGRTHQWIIHCREHQLHEGRVEGGVKNTLLPTLNL